MKPLQLLCAVLLLASCTHKNSTEETDAYSAHFKTDNFEHTGTYIWAFDLMGGEQVSTHTLYPDSITYTMTGKVYSTNYTMKKLSYEKENGKWIGEDENRIVYVLFFKNATDSTLTIYKRKCKASGLDEAINFDLPASDATDDHGWNIYALNGIDTRDILPISGNFSHVKGDISIRDSIVIWDKKEVEKMSFHTGERRWVGKHNDQYLQLFFEKLEASDSIRLSATWSDDLEALYNTKYTSVSNWKTFHVSE